MVGAVIAPSLSGIVENLNFSYSPGLLITLPSLGVVLFGPFVGGLLNKLGTFKLLVLGLVPYALLGVAGAFISNDYLLILDRLLLGAATVIVQVAVTAFIAELFSGETRMKIIAWQGMAIEIGGVVFLAIGGVLGEMNWKNPFYIYLVALVCLVLVLKFLPKSVDKEKEIVEKTNEQTENKFKVKIIFSASLLAMMLFFIGYVTMPLHLPEAYGLSESKTGYFMALISLIAVITASQMPKAVKFIGEGKTLVLGFVFFMLGYLVLATTSGVALLILTAVFIGIGFGFTIPLLNHMMLDASTPKSQGKNLGLFSVGVFGGQFLSTFIEYVSHNYLAIYMITAAMALCIGLVFLYLFQKKFK
jgi:MFS family permease